MTAAELTARRLADDLRSLGLESGSRVVLHSSFRSVGPVRGGPSRVLDTMLEVVGNAGLVMAPTFTYVSNRFERETTPGRTGAISEALRTHPAAARSLHPFYSLAAVGSGAEELFAGHEGMPGTDVGCPLGKLAEQGGVVLLLGVGHVANTTIHVGEFKAGALYLDIPFDPSWPRSADIAFPDGSELHVEYDLFPGCSRAFGTVEHLLRARAQIRDGMVGRAAAQLVAGRDVIDATVDLLAEDAGALLCRDLRCYRCTRARERLMSAARGLEEGGGRAR